MADALDPGGIAESAAQIVLELNQIAKLLNDEKLEKQEFTKRTVEKLRNAHPAFNVMVVHSSFTQTFTGSVTHIHYEQPLHGGRTYGYEIYTFKSGEFWLQGDGGFENWCFGGNFVKDGNHVTFSAPSPPHPPPSHPPPHHPPTPPPPPPPAPPQIKDGVYLVNSYKGNQQSSGFAWFPDALNIDGHQPGAYIDIAQGVYIWEGKVSSGTFKDGNIFDCVVNADAHTKLQDTLVGTAKNNFRTFGVHKDNFRVLYTIDGWEVHTVYRCV